MNFPIFQVYGDKRFLFDIVANGRNGIDVDKYVICYLLSRLLTPGCRVLVPMLWRFIYVSYILAFFRFDYIERDTRACGLGRNFDYHRLELYSQSFFLCLLSVTLLVKLSACRSLAQAMYYLMNTMSYSYLVINISSPILKCVFLPSVVNLIQMSQR